ncbi:hypothetical protein AB0I95_15165 [Micromonospora sp. NPDC049751]|uniref:hypothetical protein n=1 Tax=Micromonospora sp. NPDC049751 TaxID=3154837 RepID=UPI0033CB7B71
MAQIAIAQLSTWNELHDLPVGSIVRDAEGDEFIKAKDGRFKGIGGLDFSAFSLAVFAPVAVLNPEILDPSRFQQGDEVEVVRQFFWGIRLGEKGEVVGVEPGINRKLIEVRLHKGGLHFYFTNSEITHV